MITDLTHHPLLFNYYVNNFGTYNKVYGSIGSIMVVMLWLEFNCLIILIGFDLNAKIYQNSVKLTITH
ncbi:MAG: hypothetical protein EXR80_09705 [Methylococcales bacterium]|nr:hypothetical protein [Methylococcales bacterium]